MVSTNDLLAFTLQERNGAIYVVPIVRFGDHVATRSATTLNLVFQAGPRTICVVGVFALPHEEGFLKHV